MAKPTEKSPEINAFLSGFAGADREKTIRNNRCMFCKGGATEFRNATSRKEYRISGLCQHCQDEEFGE